MIEREAAVHHLTDGDRIVLGHDWLLYNALHRDDTGLSTVNNRCRGVRAVGAVIVDGECPASQIIDAEFILASLINQPAGGDRQALNREFVGVLNNRNDQIGSQADCNTEVDIFVNLNTVGCELGIHQWKCSQRFDHGAHKKTGAV